jgi:hypothetical protein
MKNRVPLAAVTILLATLLTAQPAGAQWVFVARKAVGKIQTMTQKEKTDAPGYSVATVILSGNADKVFARAVDTAQKSERVRLTSQDPTTRTLEFRTSADVVAGLRVSQVDSKKVQILIASTASPGGSDATSAVVEATLRICKELGANCEVVK